MSQPTDPSEAPDFSLEHFKPCDLPPSQDEHLKVVAETVRSRKELGDLVEGNPMFVPWAVVIPYVVREDMHHALIFVRAPTASAAASVGIMLWDQRIRQNFPEWIDPSADYQGQINMRRLDEGDYRYTFHELWKKARTDIHKYPLIMAGCASHHCTAFYAPWYDVEQHDFSNMRSNWLDNRIIEAS